MLLDLMELDVQGAYIATTSGAFLGAMRVQETEGYQGNVLATRATSGAAPGNAAVYEKYAVGPVGRGTDPNTDQRTGTLVQSSATFDPLQ